MLIPALIMGLKDPSAIGAALVGLQRGKEQRLARYENELERAERKRREAADFYARAVENASAIEDEVEFERWRQMIGPSAEFHGFSPHAFAFNATRATKKKRADLVAALDAIERRDPDRVHDNSFSVVTEDHPEGVHVAIVRGWRGKATKDGQELLPKPKPTSSVFKPDNLGEFRLSAYARSKGVQVEDLTPEQITEALGPDAPEAADVREMLVDGKRAVVFVDRRTRKIHDVNGNDVTARVRPLEDAPSQPTAMERTAERREQQERLRGRLRLALRSPASYDLNALARDMKAAGLDFDVERDAAARAIEREGLDRARTVDQLPPDVTDGVTSADALLQAFDAERTRQGSGRAPTPAAGGGAGSGSSPARPRSTRTATKAQVQEVATRLKVSYDEAKRQLEARGVKVTD